MNVVCLICNLIFLLNPTSNNSSNGFFILFQSKTYSNLKSLNSQLDTSFPVSLMAFSQVEIASSSPFDYVLRDQNRREKWGRESNARAAAFQKNLKDFVQSCISVPTRNSDSDFNEKSRNADSKLQIPQNNKNSKNNKKPKKNDKWANAQEMVSERETSPAQSDCSVEIPNIRVVSSLVQRWRDFEAESKNLNLNGNNSSLNSPVCSSRSNSNSTFTENTSILEIPMRNSGASEEIFETPTMAEDSSTDWESDRTATSGPPSTWSRDSNATENERIKVVDIIRRLTSVNGEELSDREQFLSLAKIRTSFENPQEMRGFAGATASPRIRGRQAFKDLLMQMERQRNKEIEALGERKAVSKFSQRGRIQALLRLRLLRHGVEAKNGSKFNSTAPERNKHPQGSSIMHLRERFNTGVEHNAADPPKSPRREVINNTKDVEKSSASKQPKEVIDQTPNAENSSTSNQLKEETQPREVAHPKSPHKNVINNTPDTETCFTSDHLKEYINHKDVITPQPSTSQLQNSENLQKEASPSLDVMLQGTSYEVRNFETRESADTITSLSVLNGKNEEQHATKVQSSASLTDWIKDISPLQGDWENQETNEGLETGTNWTRDFSQAPDVWEEEELSYQQIEESYQDWINDVSRPRSDWEGLRQERYQEMLDPFTDNGDIKTLLGSRSVSTFLSSALRERIDQLMISRTQGQQDVVNNQVEEHMEEDEKEENKQEEAAAEQYEEADEENKSQIARQYSEVGEYFDQTPSSITSPTPSLFKSWSRNQDHDVSDDSFSTPSMQQSFSSSSYTRDNNQQCSSFKNHRPSVEMELMYGLREHMEQLHQEIIDLRKALKSCIKMQVKMQHSMKQKAANSPSHSARKKGNESKNRTQRKGTCCLCCESEVDSLLYRCGHMCTCYKCAQELQWGSGNCPICRAPILDVVRTYLDYRF